MLHLILSCQLRPNMTDNDHVVRPRVKCTCGPDRTERLLSLVGKALLLQSSPLHRVHCTNLCKPMYHLRCYIWEKSDKMKNRRKNTTRKGSVGLKSCSLSALHISPFLSVNKSWFTSVNIFVSPSFLSFSHPVVEGKKSAISCITA